MNKRWNGWLILTVLLILQPVNAGAQREGATPASVWVSETGGSVSLHFPQLAGVFRLGIGTDTQSFWLDERRCERKQEQAGGLTLTWRNLFGKGDSYVVRFRELTDTKGFILETEGDALPAGVQLYWAFGGCYGEVLTHKKSVSLDPAYCKDNVCSVEGTAFTVYYGEIMRLRTVHGITPLESRICLCDAHSQQSPLTLFQSGKKTDAPILSAACPVKNGEKYYFCFYAQNRVADYDYYRLPELFAKESSHK